MKQMTQRSPKTEQVEILSSDKRRRVLLIAASKGVDAWYYRTTRSWTPEEGEQPWLFDHHAYMNIDLTQATELAARIIDAPVIIGRR